MEKVQSWAMVRVRIFFVQRARPKSVNKAYR